MDNTIIYHHRKAGIGDSVNIAVEWRCTTYASHPFGFCLANKEKKYFFIGLELGVAILQAYVFTILICIYLNDVFGYYTIKYFGLFYHKPFVGYFTLFNIVNFWLFTIKYSRLFYHGPLLVILHYLT